MCNDNRLTGFAICVVLQEDIKCDYFRCRLTFEYDGRTHILLDDDRLNDSFSYSGRQMGHMVRDHTFLWKYYLMDPTSIYRVIYSFHKFTFEISKYMSHRQEILEVKECGIRPLYTKEQDVFGDLVDSSSVSEFQIMAWMKRSGRESL